MNLQQALQAAKGSNVDISLIESVLGGEASVNTVDQICGDTALHQAVKSRQALLVETLLKRGVDIDMPNQSGLTPLHEAVRSDSYSMVELLLHWDARVNVQDGRSGTPLLQAIHSPQDGERKILQLLLRYGAYSHPDAQADQNLQRFFASKNQKEMEENQAFYTTLLLAGVPVPEKTTLPPSLQVIQCHLEGTIWFWLKTLVLLPKECARVTPRVLQALPQLKKWVDAIPLIEAQSFGLKLLEATVQYAKAVQQEKNKAFFGRLQSLAPEPRLTAPWQRAWERHGTFLQYLDKNQALIQDLESAPIEQQEAVKESLVQQELAALVSYHAQKTYKLPPHVAAYLVDNLRQQSEYAVFDRDRFNHDWCNGPWVPPPGIRSASSLVGAVVDSYQFHTGRLSESEEITSKP